MTVDVVCAVRPFLDLTLVGLEALPGPGEERHAEDLARSPGGGAIVAIAAARLGLTVAMAAPLGSDEAGDFLRAALADEGVRIAGRSVERTPTTVVMPCGDERAMATFDPRCDASGVELAAVSARAAVLGLPLLASAPEDAMLYVTVGDAEAREFAEQLPAGLARARALFCNTREALVLTGASDVESAARALAEHVPCAIVTLGSQGALAASGEELLRAEGHPVTAVDSTGAGDLFMAAYVWADLSGATPDDRLRWAVLHSSRSVRIPTALAGAGNLAALTAAGAEQGLTPPDRPLSASVIETAGKGAE